MSGPRHDCSRTRGLVDRLVVGSVRDDDRRHAASCPSCGPVVARAARFDDELGRSAKQLIAEDLPREILDPGLSRKVAVVPLMPALAPGATAGVAALALIVVMATAVGIPPVLLPGPSATEPPFAQEVPGDTAPPDAPLHTLNEMTAALTEALDYACSAGDAPPTSGAGDDAVASAVCTAPDGTGPFTAAVTLDVSESGMVVRVTILAEVVEVIPQDKREPVRRAIAGVLAKVTAEAFIDPGASVRAANFVFGKASQMSGPAWAMGIEEDGVRVDLERLADGGYIVHLSVA